jgi:hypothetical protein
MDARAKLVPSESSARENPVLAEHANAIRRLGKQTVENIIEIGRHLVEAKAEVKKLGGSFDAWLKAEFNWSHGQAYNFINVFERKSELSKFDKSDLPISAFYLLAAPSTPAEARDELVERAQAGGAVAVAEVKRVIEDAKGRKQSARKPTTKPQVGKSAGGHKKAFGETIVDIDEAGFDVLDVPLKPAHERIARKLHNQFGKAPGEVQHHFVRHFLGFLPGDIDPRSADEIARQDAEIRELRSTEHRLKNKVAELESEIEGLRGKLAGTGGDMSISEFQTAHKNWEEAFEVQRGIIARLQNENAELRARVAAPPANDGLDMPERLPRSAS